jgi:hypothetical protein
VLAGHGIFERLRVLRASRGALVVATVFAAGVALRIAFLVIYRPAFLGIPDTGSYLDAAHRGLFDNIYDPAGYPLLIRVLHAIYPHLSLLIVVQHALGVGTAALTYLAVRRVTGSTLLGLIPAALVLFDGYALWVEHTPITETLFAFLVAAVLYVAIRASEGRVRLLVLDGVLIAIAGTVRPIGFTLIVVVAPWILWALRFRAPARSHARARERSLALLAVLAPMLVVGAGYVLVQRAVTGYTGITKDSGRILYAQAARFADCSKFTPPAGTAALCETTPSEERGSFNQYLTGFPDGAKQVTPGGRSVSPAWRVFGPPPAGNSKLEAFGIAAILHQPLDYLGQIVGDFHYYWSDHHRAFIAAAARVDPGIDRIVTSYYNTGPGVSSDGLGFLRWYGDTIEVNGVLMIVLLLAPLTALLVADRRVRRAAVLFAAAGWLLPLASDAAASVDPRFMLPAYGPLAAAAAIGLGRRRSARGERRIADRLRRRPWRRAHVPAAVLKYPSMLYEQELSLLFGAARESRGAGEIVDAGCFLGGSTFALASGLAASRRHAAADPGVIHSYDLFRLDALTKLQYGHLLGDAEVGESLRPLFDELLGSVRERVVVHEGDIRDQRWSGAPIEILFLDICKSWDLNDHVVKQFFPSLLPDRSILIQQDFVHEWLPFIPVTMGLLADAFEFAGFAQPSTALFVPTRRIDAEEIPVDLKRELSAERQLECFDRACRPFTGKEKGVLHCGRAVLLLELGRHAEALDALDAIEPGSSTRVATAVSETRSWLLRSDPDPAVSGPAWERWHQTTGA